MELPLVWLVTIRWGRDTATRMVGTGPGDGGTHRPMIRRPAVCMPELPGLAQVRAAIEQFLNSASQGVRSGFREKSFGTGIAHLLDTPGSAILS
jgi:hypothetical protein